MKNNSESPREGITLPRNVHFYLRYPSLACFGLYTIFESTTPKERDLMTTDRFMSAVDQSSVLPSLVQTNQDKSIARVLVPSFSNAAKKAEALLNNPEII